VQIPTASDGGEEADTDGADELVEAVGGRLAKGRGRDAGHSVAVKEAHDRRQGEGLLVIDRAVHARTVMVGQRMPRHRWQIMMSVVEPKCKTNHESATFMMMVGGIPKIEVEDEVAEIGSNPAVAGRRLRFHPFEPLVRGERRERYNKKRT
jgi:hypothetical protein